MCNYVRDIFFRNVNISLEICVDAFELIQNVNISLDPYIDPDTRDPTWIPRWIPLRILIWIQYAPDMDPLWIPMWSLYGSRR